MCHSLGLYFAGATHNWEDGNCHLSEMMIWDRNISVLKIIQHINEGLCSLWASYAYHMSKLLAAQYFKSRVRKLEAYIAIQNISNCLESWKQDSTMNLYL